MDARNSMRVWIDYVVKIAIIITAAGVIWIMTTIHSLDVSVAVIATDMDNMKKQFDAMTRNRYTNADAIRDFTRIDGEIIEIKRRVTRLEK